MPAAGRQFGVIGKPECVRSPDRAQIDAPAALTVVVPAIDEAEALGPLPQPETRQQSLPLEQPMASTSQKAARRGTDRAPVVPAPPPESRSLAETAQLRLSA